MLRKTAFAGGVTGIGAVVPVSASSSSSKRDVDDLLESEEVKSIREAIPNLRLQTARAEVVDGTSITKVPANFGTLVVVSNPEGGRAAVFNFTTYRPGLEEDWPKGTDAAYIGTKAGAVFRRELTEDELEELARAVDLAGERISVAKNGRTGGFELLERNEEEKILQMHRIEPRFSARSASSTDSPYTITETEILYGGSAVLIER